MQQSGRSMIEMLGVLAIIAILTVGGIAGYSKALMKYRTYKTMNQITHAVVRTRIAFITQKNYAGLGRNKVETANVIVSTGILPRDTIVRAGNGRFLLPYRFKNSFRGSISMRTGDRISKGDKSAFIIHYDYIPKSACIEIATGAWGDVDGSGFVMLTVNEPITADMNARKCKSTPASQKGSAVHCSRKKVMLNAAAAHACKEKDNTLELMFY